MAKWPLCMRSLLCLCAYFALLHCNSTPLSNNQYVILGTRALAAIEMREDLLQWKLQTDHLNDRMPPMYLIWKKIDICFWRISKILKINITPFRSLLLNSYCKSYSGRFKISKWHLMKISLHSYIQTKKPNTTNHISDLGQKRIRESNNLTTCRSI